MSRLDTFELKTPSSGPGPAEADSFARDPAWLRDRGVAVSRHTLDRDRAAFFANEQVRALLETQGTTALPLVLADDTVLSAGAYPTRPELARALRLSAADDEAYLAGIAAVGVALGLKLAAHEAGAIERVWQDLRRLGLAGRTFQDAVWAILEKTGATDAQIVETLDGRCVHGTLRAPGGGCCGGRSAGPGGLAPRKSGA